MSNKFTGSQSKNLHRCKTPRAIPESLFENMWHISLKSIFNESVELNFCVRLLTENGVLLNSFSLACYIERIVLARFSLADDSPNRRSSNVK